MTDTFDTIGGLLATAEENQKAVVQATAVAERAGQQLDSAAKRWEETGAVIVRACGTAIGEAVAKEAQTLAARIEAPFVVPVQRLERAAVELDHAVRHIEWAWLVAVFMAGVLVGVVPLWLITQSRLDTLLTYVQQIDAQTAKMPAAAVNPVPKKGGK